MDVSSATSGTAINQGLVGMQRSQLEIARSAQQIAGANLEGQQAAPVDLTEPLVNLKAQTQLFDASAKMIKAADETIGTLLNARA